IPNIMTQKWDMNGYFSFLNAKIESLYFFAIFRSESIAVKPLLRLCSKEKTLSSLLEIDRISSTIMRSMQSCLAICFFAQQTVMHHFGYIILASLLLS
ncbi:MAG: hypothetical protein J1F36_06755, partial [Clostridiales bacterium]|nr:hypothetical protein [Clostridiales bacterium]